MTMTVDEARATMKTWATPEAIDLAVQHMATQIDLWNRSREELCIVGVLDGSFMLVSDLVRRLRSPLSVEFVGLTSYPGMHPGDTIEWTKRLARPYRLSGKRVLIVDDICESGRTLLTVKTQVERAGAREVRFCTLLHKVGCGETTPHFVGFRCHPEEFMVGYGLDFDGRFRELPSLASIPR